MLLPAHGNLPVTLQRLVDVIGVEAAIALSLSARRGVARKRSALLYIPKKLTRTHWITLAIGEAAAFELWHAHAGEIISIAKPDAISRAWRDESIEKRLRTQTIETVACAFGLSTRQIRTIAGRRHRPRSARATHE